MSIRAKLIRLLYKDTKMNYMLLIYDDELVSGGFREGVAFDACLQHCDGLVERLHAKGKYISAGILQPTPAATTLRIRDGQNVVTDGPFAETREQLAGFLLIDADSVEEALAVAAEHPVAKTGSVEVRPMYGMPFLEGKK